MESIHYLTISFLFSLLFQALNYEFFPAKIVFSA